MIYYNTGDLLASGADYICHQVNCRGVMGSGVAKQIKNKWPVVFDLYHERVMCSNISALLGDVQYVDIGNNQTVVNMFAQADYGYNGKRYTSYDAFAQCLQCMSENIPEDKTIAMPYKIGSDRGGANWNIISNMIEVILGKNHTVFLYCLEERK